jgi:hypothetical protein
MNVNQKDIALNTRMKMASTTIAEEGNINKSTK